MASRIMHLAIANEIEKQISIRDFERFQVGSILPDAYANGVSTAESHLKIKINKQTQNTYKLSYFRERYQEELKHDSLYLGYYMHLVQDILFRHFVYDDYKWDPVPKGNIKRLHKNYGLINKYVIKQYGLTEKIDISEKLKPEKIMEIYPFDLEQLAKNLQNDFHVPYDGEIFFFTEEMADEYIVRATKKCLEEIEAIQKGMHIIDEEKYAWKSHA